MTGQRIGNGPVRPECQSPACPAGIAHRMVTVPDAVGLSWVAGQVSMPATVPALSRALMRGLAGLAVLAAFVWPPLPCLCAFIVLLLGADLFHPSITEDR